MMEGFIQGYGMVDDHVSFRTAIQIGAHLICVTSIMGWGDDQQIEQAVAVGRDIIVHAWKKDKEWFERSEFRSLFR